MNTKNIFLHTPTARFCMIFAILWPCINSKVIFPALDLSFDSAQLTPRGYDHPLCESTTSILMFGSDDIPEEVYPGTIVLAVGSGKGFVDDIIFKYMDLGAAGVIIMGGAKIYPGDGTQKFRNVRSFAYEVNGTKTIFPAVGIVYPDFGPIFQIFNETTLMSGFTDFVVVTITCEAEDNHWKAIGTTAIYRTIQVLNGILCLFNLVWGAKIIQLIVKGNLTKRAIVPLVAISLNMFGCILRIIGLINFENYMQLYDYITGSFFSSAGVGPIFSSCWLQTLMLLENLDRNLEIKLFLGRLRWPFFLVSAVLLANDWTLSIIRGLEYEDPYAPLYIAIVQIAMTVGLAVCLSFIYTIVCAKAIHVIRHMREDKKKGKLLRKTLITFLIMASMFIGYALSAGITFTILDDPVKLTYTWIYYTLNLSCVSTCINFGVYTNIRDRLFKSSTEVKPTNSTELTNSAPIESPRPNV